MTQEKRKEKKDTEPFLCHYIKIVLLQKYKLGLLIRQLRSESGICCQSAIKRQNEQNQTDFFFCILAEYKKEEMPVK